MSGGKDAGFLIVTRTMTCLDCKEVVDVAVGESQPGSLGRDIHLSGRCPLCRHLRVVPWPNSRPCPKCGGTMKKLDTGRVVFWD